VVAVTAAVGVLGSLLGLVVGKLWDRRAEDRRWLREARSRGYDGFVRSFQDLRQAIRTLAVNSPDSTEWANALRKRRTYWSAYNASMTDIEAFGSPDLYLAATRVDSCLRSASHTALRGGFTIEAWDAIREPVDTAMRDYVAAMRKDLHLPLHTRGSGQVASADARIDGH
jgi:hypothetical protein